MIKILFFIETLTGGGAEKVLCDLVNHMDQRKFDITVQTAFPCESSKYLVPGICFKSMYAADSKANRLRYRAEAQSGLAYWLHIKDNYDIECAYLEMGSTKVMASSTNRKAKKLAWVHCDLGKAVVNPKGLFEKTAPWYEKFDQVVCVSQSVKRQFDKLFKNRFNTSVLYNVVDDAVIREKALLPLPISVQKSEFTVLSVGRLTAQKRFIRLLQAHKRLLNEGIKHNIWILGEGPDRRMLEQFVTDNNLQDSVWMPGFVENPYPFIKEADLLVCSSVFEGYSTFMTEGVILGKPIVTTNVSGAEELFGDSEYGLITENDDIAFCDGLRQMISDSVLREVYCNKAALRGKAFSAEVLTKQTEEFFLSLLGGSN